MLTLHHAPNSRSGRIVWLLEELNLPYDLNRMEFHPSALKSDEHRARHPLGRVPVLEDGDLTLFESGAIVEYVIARHGKGALKPSVDSPEFPEFLQWFHYCEGMVMPPMNTIVVQTILLPPERRNEEALGQAQRLLSKALAPVDRALEGREYLIGDFSAADIMLGHAVYMANRLGCVGDEMTNLKAYVARLEARPAFQKGIAA
ncbi:MAG: glutathione S-transferase family protein [Myxococcales bacterium]|nr:glutathione S-transferase family protein [Myxococcales bacterium]